MNWTGTSAFIAVIMVAALGVLNNCGGIDRPPPPPSGFLLTLPSNTTLSPAGLNPTLIWEDASGETGYTVQISTSQTFTANTYSVLLSANATSYLITTPTYSLVVGTPYYWQVLATNQWGVTKASNAPFSFTP